MIHFPKHIEDPLGAELEKADLQFGITIEHAMSNESHESKLGGNHFANQIGVLETMAELFKWRIAHSHVYTQRYFSLGKFIPYGSKNRVREQPVARGPEEDSRCSAQRLHLVERFDRLGGFAQRQQSRPFEPLWIELTTLGHIAVIGSIQRGFKARVGGHACV